MAHTNGGMSRANFNNYTQLFCIGISFSRSCSYLTINSSHASVQFVSYSSKQYHIFIFTSICDSTYKRKPLRVTPFSITQFSKAGNKNQAKVHGAQCFYIRTYPTYSRIIFLAIACPGEAVPGCEIGGNK